MVEDWLGARRFHALPPALRRIVFYAEDGDSWPHYEPIVRELTGACGREVCYLTSSRNDPILRAGLPRVHPFRIGEGAVRTSLFMSLKAGVMVMTMPDLETFHIKRSRRQHVHYAYVFHSMVSTQMIYRRGAFDHFDTILCAGPHHVREIRATEAAYGLKPKQLVEHGYGRLDTMLAAPSRPAGTPGTIGRGGSRHVLVAPSWGPHGLLETRGVETCRALLEAGFRVTVRPHPMTRRKWPEAIRAVERSCGGGSFAIEADIASAASLESADLMISDWSGAALEFAFGRERPVLFVDVPRKVNNPEHERIGCVPLEVSIRDRIGQIVAADRIADLGPAAAALCDQADGWRGRIRAVREETIYNLGRSGQVAARELCRIADATGKEEQAA